MNTAAYLERIHHTRHVEPDVNTLHELQVAHLQSIPFENLDIGLKRVIQINEPDIWNKLIVNKRGGFCYELNGLFAWLLKQIGFEVTYLNARVFNSKGDLGIDFDHLALLVGIPHQSMRWLVDVGFGDSFNEPLSFEERG
jgi:N-hydroxyarylamine O-acetyltransferase